ncbi:helix-turn-helix domain-containing protein [Streptomyces sp. AK04-3B]|uniref:helix-turn-helix domain-containing protein n=2 Tax=unclassified Streptomyces TaxID=2593676 RepID=UPI0029A644E0|nr:helix-turn-helix domain-containing protein [Streptomyces sp. AK04-3B]MDX3802192.1 helix-turn-helix domain-containing protein [Streptomyces sp. AK04-3B]
MKELAGRLTALDPDAGAAVRVIAYFDRLTEGRAGVEALVRGAAVLAGVPARLVDAGRGVRIRIEADGVRRDPGPPPDPAWPSAALTPDGAPAFWLERADATPSVVDAVILERAAGAARLVLDRTRGRAPLEDPALVETLLDAAAAEPARLHAARRLGLDLLAPARALATAGGRPRVVPAPAVPGSAEPPAVRTGVGPAVPVLELPGSWDAARIALRFTAEGGALDPGPRVVYADELGGIALLAELVAPGGEPPPDVRALDRAAADAPWLLATLYAVTATASLRAAAAEANVHHSTLQDRLAHAEHLLGWPVRTPQGRLRLHLALTTRRLTRQ